MNEPKLKQKKEITLDEFKSWFPQKPATQPKLTFKEQSYQNIYGENPKPTYADSTALGIAMTPYQKEQLKLAKERNQRQNSLYSERIKKLRTGTTKEPDYMKKAETLSTKIANIDKSLEEMTQQFEKSPEVGTYVKKTVGGEPAYKPAVSEEQKAAKISKRIQYAKELQIANRNYKIQEYAKRHKLSTNDLVNKFNKFEQITQEVESDPDKYVSGVIADSEKRRQAILAAIFQRSAKEVGIDKDDVETILEIKIK